MSAERKKNVLDLHLLKYMSWLREIRVSLVNLNSLPSAIRHPQSWGPLRSISLNKEIPGARTGARTVNGSSNMAAKTRFDLPWLLSSLDKSGVKNGLALIGKTHCYTSLTYFLPPNKKLFLELIVLNKCSDAAVFRVC